MRSRLLALGLFSVAAIHPVLAAQPDPGAPGDEPPAIGRRDDASPGPMPWPGPHGPMRHGPMPHGQEGFGFRRMGPPPPEMLAARLSALETRIGIRSELLDAWRDYTSALQAVLAPPRFDHGPSAPGEPGGPDAGGPGTPGGPDLAKRDPFAFQERLADEVTKRAASAAKLKDAIAVLRSKLTPEQLELLASADRPHGPPPGPWGNPPDDAAGPGGPHGQLQPSQPRNDEQL
ncbi:MAG: hypothetical protein EOR43_22365 [Mesorhizobium sp.]|uniref:hypothetical protein n=1 Tax=Mesorhizobium sp. TaxID=1871066 RepID=UPI000FE41238|nr:hypothetical protein [Mesorhizobium sp.]RWK20097.1 MAG: hypothetical protein EOR43_22365 [Mesorhizobium sp.]RWK28928.1 MAG: hypothetical protein EOR44_21610 [Mesorhizobium sp.]